MPHKDLTRAKEYRRKYYSTEAAIAKRIQRAARKKAAGICSDCTEPAIQNSTRCRNCLERDHNLHLKRYGWNVQLYYKALKEQDGVCAICKRSCITGKRLAADHNHKTGKPRGLLCSKHNTALGHFEDDPNLLIEAIKYLWRHHEKCI